ncbi:LPXTG cell wall anchor domain-containing protein, partial [Leuconostoc falkenbergense]|uniref:LPXTG cell wall anchor domain-containing protein n=1 Tax=Leuconostoc falkenbergense TaxID=2766470 RepID=UPI0024AD28AF
GNPVGPEMPYGPVTPGTTVDTPYGPVIVPDNGGNVVVTIKTAVDEPEYVVTGNIVPTYPDGTPAGPEIPYGPVAPGTTIDTPYGPVEVPTNGGDITITVDFLKKEGKTPTSEPTVETLATGDHDEKKDNLTNNGNGEINQNQSTNEQLPKTSASQDNTQVAISGLILTSLLGLLALIKRRKNNN